MIHCQLSVRRNYCDAQYARDQAVASARDQAARVSPRRRRMDQYHGEHITRHLSGVFEERQARVGSPFCAYQIIITAV